MSTTRNVAVIIGSLRKDSISRRFAHALMKIAPPSLALNIVEIGNLPMYNPDTDTDPPQAARDFKAHIQNADAVLFITPEYNRSVPGALKSAIDTASRPYGHSAWNGKPGAVISLSQGAMGGFGANHHLRQSLVFLNVPVMQQPEAYIGNAGNIVSEEGTIINEATREFMQKFLQSFAQWVERNLPNKLPK